MLADAGTEAEGPQATDSNRGEMGITCGKVVEYKQHENHELYPANDIFALFPLLSY